MTVLRPMNPNTFVAYKTAEVASFAEENVASGRWPVEGALQRSLAEFDELLPEGLSTAENFLLEIVEPTGELVVGYLWFANADRGGQRVAFVYDIQILEPHRRQGYARQALVELEEIVKKMGLPRISLHVSGANPSAQALYEEIGFKIMGISMSKPIA